MFSQVLRPIYPIAGVTEFSGSPQNIPASSNPGGELLRLLPVEERGQYQTLVESIAVDVDQSRKHSSLVEFVKHVTQVHRFITRGNMNDPLRGVVCGVEFGRGFILVNTDRLKKILFRSKSCVNGCWLRLGYDVMRPSNDVVSLFMRLLPNVNPEFFAIKQWCIRLVSDESRVCFVPNLPDGIARAFESERIPSHKMILDAPKTLAEVAQDESGDIKLWDVQSLLNRKFTAFPEQILILNARK
jgi:hypothetical protein